MSSQLRVDKILPVDGVTATGGGGIVQITMGRTNNRAENTSTSFVATNLEATVTPKFTTSKIYVQVSGDCNTNQSSGSETIFLTIYRSIDGGTFSNLGNATYGFTQLRNDSARTHAPVCINFLDNPNTTSAVVYKVYMRSAAGTSVEFPADSNQNYSYMHLLEVSA